MSNLELWEETGLLEGIELPERKMELSKRLEELLNCLLADNKVNKDVDEVENISFAILRRIYCGINVSVGKFDFIVNIEDLVEEITFSWNRVGKVIKDALTNTHYDVEAEFCQLFTNEYINNLRKNRIIPNKEEYDEKFGRI